MNALLASIPSPGSKQLELGPINLRYYGLMIALGVLAAVWLAQKRWNERGGGPDDMSAVAFVGVPAGLIGARLYHVITDWGRFEDRPGDIVKIWEGGLGIPGGMLAGLLVGVWAAKRRGMSGAGTLDAVAPALPLAQAIGRWGNWFNQELFGGPTDLPWGLEIDGRYRPAEHATVETFHPTFLYESLWNLALCAGLLALDRKRIVPRGRLVFAYLVGYGVGRLWVESLRIDAANHVFGVRVNIWVSLIAIVAGLILLFRPGRQPLGGGTELDEDRLGEGGPGVDSPRPEGSIGEGDEPDSGDGIDPDEGAGLAEVPEGGS